MPGPGRRTTVLAVALGSVAAGACFQSQERGEQVEPDAPIDRSLTPCRDHDPGKTLATLGAARCPWVLQAGPDGLRLLDLAPEAKGEITGPMPEPCEDLPCDWDGALTRLGPMVVASIRSPASEMPQGAILGAAGGGRLQLIDLWGAAGESVMGDATPLGPAFTLAPYACGTTLALFAVSRLDAGDVSDPPSTLRLREGHYDLTTDPPGVTPAPKKSCTRLPVPLP